MSAAFKHIQVIINPAAGNNEPILNTLNDVFSQYDVFWDVSLTHKAGDGEQLARQAVENGADLVGAYGGDGTVGEVARGLIGSEVPLAVLPGGTGNSLAVSLRIPINLADAVKSIFESTVQPIDLGEANGQRFILRADSGVSTRMTQQTSREMKDRFGLLAYVIGAIQALGQPEQIIYRMTIDGEQIETEGIACIITNHNELGAYNERLSLNVDPGDGLLDLFIIRDVGSTLAAAAQLLGALSENPPDLQHWRAKEFYIEADPVQDYSLDGDPVGQTPLTVRVLPQAVRVLVPPAGE
ncbi:MAG TPA: diacylglycerol kinase family protein [Spirillospora sp.]|nr:diacylglycerol kinase family protein [Spirillospora sp.]